MNRIYLDNAATSWPKPDCVYRAVEHFMRDVGSSSGRGTYRSALEAGDSVLRVRRGIARLVELHDPNHVLLTNSGTEALNLAIYGLVRPADHVVTTVCEHNSVLRPLEHLRKTAGVELTLVECDAQGRVDPTEIVSSLRDETRLVAVTHGSNVTGALQPVEEIGRQMSDHGAFYLVDAAQTLGHTGLSSSACRVDLIAAPGHKALLGPQGTGVLCLSERAARELLPLTRGGTGTESESIDQPESVPHRFESGSLNTLGLAGLASALDYLQIDARSQIESRLARLTQNLCDRLRELKGVTIYGPSPKSPRCGVVSVNLEGYDPQELASLLELSSGIECRAGLHCAPLMHRALGTIEQGGTLRLSLGWNSQETDVDAAVEAIAEAGRLLG